MPKPPVKTLWQSSSPPAYVSVEPQNSDADFKAEPSEHGRLRANLCSRYGLDGEYVGAPTIALILGLGRTTVHDQIKSNRFVIPHRLADRKPLFLLDDLVAWMLGREWPSASGEELPTERSTSKSRAPGLVFKHADVHDAFMQMCERRGISPKAVAQAGERSQSQRPCKAPSK